MFVTSAISCLSWCSSSCTVDHPSLVPECFYYCQSQFLPDHLNPALYLSPVLHDQVHLSPVWLQAQLPPPTGELILRVRGTYIRIPRLGVTFSWPSPIHRRSSSSASSGLIFKVFLWLETLEAPRIAGIVEWIIESEQCSSTSIQLVQLPTPSNISGVSMVRKLGTQKIIKANESR